MANYHWSVLPADYANVIKSLENTWNSKHKINRKCREHRKISEKWIVETICCPFSFHLLLDVRQHKLVIVKLRKKIYYFERLCLWYNTFQQTITSSKNEMSKNKLWISPQTQNVNWTYIIRSEDVLNVLCTFNLRPVSTGIVQD